MAKQDRNGTMDESQETLLSQEKHYRDISDTASTDSDSSWASLEQEKHRAQISATWSRRIALWLGLAYVPLVCAFVLLYVHAMSAVKNCRSLDLFPSLAQEPDVMQFNRQKLPVKMFNNSFVGDPSPELDHAWHGLFEDVNIRVTKDDLEYAELDSLKVDDGSGDFIGQLGVHHELQ